MKTPMSWNQDARIIKLGSRHITTHGLSRRFWQDLYHYAMTVSWPCFFSAIAAIFIIINTCFAGLYLLGDHPIENLAPPGFWGSFFFSVETLATVGYGDMHPITLYAHLISTIEIFVGMMSIALFTGLIFSRFSKPKAFILFAHNAVIGPINGQETLTIRVANARLNEIIDASAKLRLIRTEISPEGVKLRRVHDLQLTRDQHPVFQLGWNIMHIINETSPLYHITPESLAANQVELILTIVGIDETTNQTMRSRHFYNYQALLWKHQYVDMFLTDEHGAEHIHYAHFHAVRPL